MNWSNMEERPMKKLNMTRVVLAILALVGFTGIKAGFTQEDLQNNSVFQNTYGNQQTYNNDLNQQEEWPETPQVSSPSRQDTVDSWKQSLNNDPSMDLPSQSGYDWFTSGEQNQLSNHQQSLLQPTNQQNSGVDSYPTTANSVESDSADSSLMTQWEDYIKDNNLNKSQLEATVGFDSFNTSDQNTLLGIALRNAINVGTSSYDDGEEEPWDDDNNVAPVNTQTSNWNNVVSGTQKARGYVNSAGQWVAGTEIGQGAIQEIKTAKTELYKELQPEVKAGTQAAVRGIISRFMKKIGLGDEYQSQLAQQPTYQQPTYQQGPQPLGVQPGTLQQPKLYPGSRGVLVQPGVNVQRTAPAGPPAPPTRAGNQTSAMMLAEYSTPPLSGTGSTDLVLPKTYGDAFAKLGAAEQKALTIYFNLAMRMKKDPTLNPSIQPVFKYIPATGPYSQRTLVNYYNQNNH